MNTSDAVLLLSPLAQEARLNIFRLLVQAGAAGLAAGQIGEQLQVPASTLSFHLKELSNAGLIQAKQSSRFIYYSANYAAMNDLLAFLTENCCANAAQAEACVTEPICCENK
jgi:ArsR family transcriptional regulator, arsenate/arsenite/antimonite-responsive transcriptional repressor